jgi:uncharacterized membrane protein YfcA
MMMNLLAFLHSRLNSVLDRLDIFQPPTPRPQLTWGLAAGVLGIAFLYSSVGFGGASGYLAVMALLQIPLNTAISTALTLNLIVAGIAFWNYYRTKHFSPELLWPFAITSIPAAFLGGRIQLDQFTYLLILHVILLAIALRMLTAGDPPEDTGELDAPSYWISGLVGAGLGLLAGMIGIGGGVFLSPIIILTKWGSPKTAAATSAGFILLNSLSGLISRVIADTFVFGAFGLTLLPLGVIGS